MRLFKVYILLLLCCFICVNCSNNLNIKTSGDFTISALPYKSSIALGATNEVNVEIKPAVNYKYPIYIIRYFQEEGDGIVSLDDGSVLQINRKYILSKNTFTGGVI